MELTEILKCRVTDEDKEHFHDVCRWYRTTPSARLRKLIKIDIEAVRRHTYDREEKPAEIDA